LGTFEEFDFKRLGESDAASRADERSENDRNCNLHGFLARGKSE
jgi:hypothetical protein